MLLNTQENRTSAKHLQGKRTTKSFELNIKNAILPLRKRSSALHTMPEFIPTQTPEKYTRLLYNMYSNTFHLSISQQTRGAFSILWLLSASTPRARMCFYGMSRGNRYLEKEVYHYHLKACLVLLNENVMFMELLDRRG